MRDPHPRRSAPPKRAAPRPKRAATRPKRAATPSKRQATSVRSRGRAVLRLPAPAANGLLDRLLRGRAWVALIGVLLAGIVFLNVTLLGLNAGIAVTSDQAAELRRENAELRLDVAKLGSSERIQRVAESRGFVMPAPGDVIYLEAHPEEDARAAALALAASRDVADTGVADGDAGVEPAGGTTAAGPAVTTGEVAPGGTAPSEPAPTAGAPPPEAAPAPSEPAPTAEAPPVPAG